MTQYFSVCIYNSKVLFLIVLLFNEYRDSLFNEYKDSAPESSDECKIENHGILGLITIMQEEFCIDVIRSRTLILIKDMLFLRIQNFIRKCKIPEF